MSVELVEEKAAAKDSRKHQRPLRVAVAGLGVIGESAALRLLQTPSEFEFCGALVRNAAKPRAPVFRSVPAFSELNALFAERPDIVIDALPCGAAGRAVIGASLSRGVHVVTANKQAVAGSLAAFHAHARQNGATLACAASVGGGAPMIETVRAARRAGDIHAITAIVNGTVNFILTEIHRGAAFGDAVKAAQIAGFAEPDPAADLSGQDARAKASILAYEAFGEEPEPDSIIVETLDASRAERLAADGRVWKQLALIENAAGGGVKASVRYGCVDDDVFLNSVDGEENALCAVTKDGGVYSCRGKGAGRAPTVDSIFSDLYEIRKLAETNAQARLSPKAEKSGSDSADSLSPMGGDSVERRRI